MNGVSLPTLLFLAALLAAIGCGRGAATPGATGGAAAAQAGPDTLAEMVRRSTRQYGSVEGIVEELAAMDVTAAIKQSNLRSLHYTEAEYAALSPQERERAVDEIDALNRFFKAVGRRGVELAGEARRAGDSGTATRYVRMLERAGLTLQDRRRRAFVRDIGESLSRAAREAAG